MKKLLLSTGFIFAIIITLTAQEKIGTYEMQYFSKGYDVMATEPKENGDYSFYISVEPVESINDLVVITINQSKLYDFKNILGEAKAVYEKWKNTAIANKIKDLDKEINLDHINFSTGWYYGNEWHFDFSTGLTAKFKILDGDYLLIIQNNNSLQASDNQFIESDGFLCVFSSAEEIDHLLSQLNLKTVTAFFNAKKSKENIFKQ